MWVKRGIQSGIQALTDSPSLFSRWLSESRMNPDQPPPYNPSAPGYPAQGYPPQGYPPQGYPQPVNMAQPNPSYPNYPAGQMPPGGPYPGPGQPPYQGYPGQPQYGWQGGPPPAPMYGEAPKNTGKHQYEVCWWWCLDSNGSTRNQI